MILKVLFALLWTLSAADGAVLRVEVNGLRNDQGVVHCELFRRADGFPNKPDKARARVKAEIKEKSALCEFANVSPGTYAVAAFHDEKETGKLEKTFLGIPKEGVGVSNDVSGHWGRPNFDQSKFEIGAEDTHITLRIRYPR